MPENWNFSHQEISNGNLIIHSVETTVSANAGPANTTRVLDDHGLTVFTDTLSINGPLSMPGQNVFIHARQINCGPGAARDVSGAAGEISVLVKRTSRPPSTQAPTVQMALAGGRG